MARIAGIDLPRDKSVLYGLPTLFGIGKHNVHELLEKAKIEPTKKVRDLDEDEVTRLREILDSDYVVEGDLRREVNSNIRRLMEIRCYRGIRHSRGLPVHGQRTRSNARTRKGKAKTVAGKKKAKK
ncbi:MAG: 30S ribosomal protein S13 [Armatimonadota bacterium]